MTIHAINVSIWSLKLKPTPFLWSRSINTSRNMETTARAKQRNKAIRSMKSRLLRPLPELRSEEEGTEAYR